MSLWRKCHIDTSSIYLFSTNTHTHTSKQRNANPFDYYRLCCYCCCGYCVAIKLDLLNISIMLQAKTNCFLIFHILDRTNCFIWSKQNWLRNDFGDLKLLYTTMSIGRCWLFVKHLKDVLLSIRNTLKWNLFELHFCESMVVVVFDSLLRNWRKERGNNWWKENITVF